MATAMDGFGGMLEEEPLPALPVMPAPPKPRFLDFIAGAFGGGPDRAGAFNEGMDQGSQFQLRSAQTQSALAQARERRAAAKESERQLASREAFRATVEANGGDPSMVDLLDAGYGGNWEQLQGGELNRQELGFREMLADPAASLPNQIAAQQGVQGEVARRYYQPAPGYLSNIADPNQTPELTSIGEADIRATDALAGQRNRSPQASGAAPGSVVYKTSQGITYRVTTNPDGTFTETPVGDPSVIAANAAARAGGTQTGQKQVGLEAQLNAINEMRVVAGNLVNSEGINGLYGASSLANPLTTRLGGDTAAAETIRQQLGSRGFLASIQQMRGLGQLSNAEGLKVESALQRLTNTSLPDDQIPVAYDELMTSLANLERVAQQEASAVPNVFAGGTPGAPAAGGRAFNSAEEAEAAAIREGWNAPTKVTIGGRPATWSP